MLVTLSGPSGPGVLSLQKAPLWRSTCRYQVLRELSWGGGGGGGE